MQRSKKTAKRLRKKLAQPKISQMRLTKFLIALWTLLFQRSKRSMPTRTKPLMSVMSSLIKLTLKLIGLEMF
jgi:hypothetical protein